MKAAIGLKAHSGWAVLVVIGDSGGKFQVVDRRRIELVEPESLSWARQPYHAAEGLDSSQAAGLVKRGIDAAKRSAVREMKAAVKRLRKENHEVLACAVLVPNPMPDWTTDEILAVHFRMHKAEGVLFPDALAHAAEKCELKLIRIPEKELGQQAEEALKATTDDLTSQVALLGKSVGAPWGKDQKNAALAAMIALRQRNHNAESVGEFQLRVRK
jgi:hypothetical protein